jgi:hypothetical protein
MITTLTRLSRPQVETVQRRFPLAIQARAIIVKGATVTFQVPAGAALWDASPKHVARALLLSEHNHGTGKGGLLSLAERVADVAAGGQHRDVRVTDPENEEAH